MSYNEGKESENLSLMQELAQDDRLPSLASNPEDEIFTIPAQIPQLLTENLVSQSRVIKLIRNGGLTNNILRAFYYQLLRLCFELYDQEEGKNYLQITKSVIFDRSIIENNGNEGIYKHIAQFLTELQQEQAPSFQNLLSRYHQVDKAFITILSQLATPSSTVSSGQNDIIDTKLENLCELFEVNLIINHPFYQFQQSGVYLLIESEDHCYVIYNQDDEQQHAEDDGEGDAQNEEQEEQISGQQSQLKSNIKSQISVSEVSKSKNPSQLTENNIVNDGNFMKQYTFQPQFKGQQQNFQNSNRSSQVSSAINSKQCNSRPVSNISYKSHLSSESEYKRQQIGNRYQFKGEGKAQLNLGKSQDIPENQPPYSSQDPFKKGTLKISNPYQISTRQIQQPSKLEAKQGIYYSSGTEKVQKQKQSGLGESHYVNNSLSNYYDGYYGEVQNNSIHSAVSKNDTIINLFGDMLKSGKYDGSYNQENTKPIRKQIEPERILETQEQLQKQDSSDIYPSLAGKINKVDKMQMIDRAKSVNSINEHYSDFNSVSGSKTLQYSVSDRPQIKQNYFHFQNENKNYSGIQEKPPSSVEGPSSNIETKSYLKGQAAINTFDQEEDIFYKPKRSNLKVISQVTASKQSITLPRHNDHEDSKGSIYRQFSDTRILKLLKEPHKTKVQIMRNRFKGQHFNL